MQNLNALSSGVLSSSLGQFLNNRHPIHAAAVNIKNAKM